MDDTDNGPDAATTDTQADSAALKRDFARLRASLEAVKDRLGGNAHEVLERVSAYLESGGLDTRLDKIEDELSKLGGKLKDTGRGAAAKLEAEVTEKPLASVAIAFGIGLLAANLLRRR